MRTHTKLTRRLKAQKTRELKLVQVTYAFVIGLVFVSHLAYADIVHDDDVIITSNLVVGEVATAVEGDVIHMDLNNIRLHFDDTSSAGTTDNDWEIVINASINGGDSYFVIRDVTANRFIFRIDAGALSNSLRVYNSGDVNVQSNMIVSGNIGVGGADALQDLHLLSGNTPTIRFEQDTSGGLPAQTWDIGCHESGWYVRDVSSSPSSPFILPLYVMTDAPSNSFVIGSTNGYIGLGTDVPEAPLHVFRQNGTAKLLIEEATGTTAVREMLELKNNGGSRLLFNDTSSSKTWYLAHTSNDFFSLGVDNADVLTMSTDGKLGIAMSQAEEIIHVKSTDGTVKVIVEDTFSSAISRDMLELRNTGPVRMMITNPATAAAWSIGNNTTNSLVCSLAGTAGDEFVIKQDGTVEIGAGASTIFTVSASGDVSIQGTLSQASDKNRKENIKGIDPTALLNKVIGLPITSWQFKDNAAGTRHIGPMAQDFHVLFDVGARETHIAPLDASGVALAAIKGINTKLENNNEKLDMIENQNMDFQKTITDITKRLDELEEK